MANGDRPHTPCPTVPGSPNKDYSKINESRDYDPYHGAKIRYLVGLEQDTPETTYVVYLDDELDIVWCSTNTARKASPGMRSILRRMCFLETMPMKHLERDRQEEFKHLLAQGLQGYLSCSEEPEELRKAAADAFASFAEAERRINEWNFDYVTRWYFAASIAMLAAVIWLVVLASVLRSSQVTWELAQFAFAGALGALLFFLVGLRNNAPGQLRAEVSGSEASYFTTVGVKVVVGMVSAVLIGVAMKANLLLGISSQNGLGMMPDPFSISAVAFVVCFVAGFSESLVPRFLTTFERTRGLSGEEVGAEHPRPKPVGRRNGHADHRAPSAVQPPSRVEGAVVSGELPDWMVELASAVHPQSREEGEQVGPADHPPGEAEPKKDDRADGADGT